MHVTPLYFLSYRTGKGLFARKLRCSTNVYTQRSVIELDNHSKSSFLTASLRSFHCLQKQRTLVSFVSVVLQTTPTWLFGLVFLENEAKISGKIIWAMFYEWRKGHMQKFRQFWAKWKNGLKFDIRRLCSQPFIYLFKAYAQSATNDSDIARNIHEKALQ